MHLPSQNQPNVNIFSCLLNSPWQKNEKKPHQFVQGKSVEKGLKICTHRFLGMLITMHYVRTLCYKYFLSYDGFSELPLTKNEKRTINLYREKVFGKAWISAPIGFWVCWLQCTMLELCVTSMLLSYDGFFPWFLIGRSRYRVQKHGVWIE